MVSCDRLRLLVGERKLCGNLRPVSPRAAECQCRALCVSSTASLFFFHFLFTILTGQSLSQHCVWCHSLCLSSSSFKTPQCYPHFKCNTTGIFLNIFFLRNLRVIICLVSQLLLSLSSVFVIFIIILNRGLFFHSTFSEQYKRKVT